MSADIISIGELIVEVMRPGVDQPLDRPGEFVGPFPSGAPAIFIDCAAKLGGSCGFIGAVGNDDFGSLCIERLRADGIDISRISRVDGYATGVAFVGYFADGSRKFLFHIAHAAAGQIPRVDKNYARAGRFLHVCGCTLSMSELMRDRCYAAVNAITEGGGRVSFDPNLRPELLGPDQFRSLCMPVVEKCYLMLPSANEAELIAGRDDPDEACKALLDMGPKIVALKRGAKGCRVFSAEGVFDSPGFSIDEIDPTGAGDCFDAGFVTGLMEGLPLDETARLANAAGALSASRKGPMEGTFPRAEVERFMANG
ncbi:MAG: sugar kinase [Candidatus Hydrogenedentes bacterium]|nr:sugar kinase [Candidatus Hydrogenedentota bacterium]